MSLDPDLLPTTQDLPGYSLAKTVASLVDGMFLVNVSLPVREAQQHCGARGAPPPQNGRPSETRAGAF